MFTAVTQFDEGLGVTPSFEPHGPTGIRAKSVAVTGGGGLEKSSPTYVSFEPMGMPTKSYSVSPDGSVSYLTPVQMGRHELYELVPFTAIWGMQKKERALSRAFASYAAELDVMEADQNLMSKEKRHLSSIELQERRSHASEVMLKDLEHDATTVTVPLVNAVLIAAMSQFVVGYNIGVMNAPENVVFVGHSTGIWSLAVAAFAVGGPFGANVAGTLADTKGRRGAILINMWTFLAGGIIQTLALDMIMIIVSRFVIGFASGFASVLVPIYLGELAPPTLRGTLGTMTQFALVTGILVSDLLAFPFATKSLWRVLFAVTPAICAIQLIFSPFLLESPRWLLGIDPASKTAREITKKLRGMRYDFEVEIEVNHFLAACKAQQVDSSVNADSQNVLAQMFSDRKLRKLLIASLFLQMAQQLCGINAVFYYSTMFFDGVISNPLVGTTIVGAVNVVATYVALLLMDSCGRRTLILWSSGGMFLCCVVIVLSLLGYFQNMVALLAVNLYVSFFEIGLGPIPWLIVAEMFDARYVTTAMSACSQLNWVCNFIVGLVFPYLNKYLHAFSFGPFAVVLLATFVFALIWLPETQGMTPEELQAQLVEKNSSVIYHNIDIEGANKTPFDVDWRSAMEKLKIEEEEESEER